MSEELVKFDFDGHDTYPDAICSYYHVVARYYTISESNNPVLMINGRAFVIEPQLGRRSLAFTNGGCHQHLVHVDSVEQVIDLRGSN